jgi:hypothetical protein
MTSWVLFAITILGLITALVIAHTQFGITFERKGIWFFLIAIPPLLIGSAFGYWLGGYALKTNSNVADS